MIIHDLWRLSTYALWFKSRMNFESFPSKEGSKTSPRSKEMPHPPFYPLLLGGPLLLFRRAVLFRMQARVATQSLVVVLSTLVIMSTVGAASVTPPARKVPAPKNTTCDLQQDRSFSQTLLIAEDTSAPAVPAALTGDQDAIVSPHRPGLARPLPQMLETAIKHMNHPQTLSL